MKLSNLKPENLYIYMPYNPQVTLICNLHSGVEYQHKQHIEKTINEYGFEYLHTEPYSKKEHINRYLLELKPLSVFEKVTAKELMHMFDCSLENIHEVWKLIQKEITVNDLSYSTYKMLVKNSIDFLGYIEKDMAIDVNTIQHSVFSFTLTKQYNYDL